MDHIFVGHLSQHGSYFCWSLMSTWIIFLLATHVNMDHIFVGHSCHYESYFCLSVSMYHILLDTHVSLGHILLVSHVMLLEVLDSILVIPGVHVPLRQDGL